MLKSLLPLCILLVAEAAADPSGAILKSPNEQIAITFGTVSGKSRSGNQLVYSVTFHGKPLIENSALAPEFAGARSLGSDVQIVKQTPSQVYETYRLITGKVSTVHSRANALTLQIEETRGLHRKFAIEARAYDDTVAFRYVVPEQNTMREFRLARENTE
ncbi:MAG: glycoside hydrolase family 97 N-terminal domain-containing protein, partial [Bryobacteraceae bacterium]